MNTEDFNLIYGIRDSINEKDKKIKLIKLYKLLQQLTKKLIEKGYKDFPTNIPELLYFLGNIPMKEYIDDGTLEGVAIDAYLDLTEEFLERASEDDVEEAGQKLMYQLLKYIRESKLKDKDEVYKKIKEFIINNYYISLRDLEIEVKRNFGYDIYIMIKKMYENANDINGEYLLCPVCGKELNLEDKRNGTCSKVCDYYINKYNLKAKKKIFNNRILRLNEGVYRFNLMSSIGEFEIYKKCVERFRGKEVILYPNVDEYDISIKDYGPYYLIKGYLPGLTPKDVNIDFEENKAILTIKKKQTYSNGRNVRMTIIQTGGDLIKTFYVEEIDVTKLKASFDNDLLLLTLPKKKQIKSKDVVVEDDSPTIIDVDNYKVE